jgi:muramoyltetrapeptide carboxypeptidase
MGHYLAGRDADRLDDVNDALRDPGVKAIFCTSGGKGSYRIAHGLDVDAARRNPKLLIGFSDITTLHLMLWKHGGAPGLHGPMMSWDDRWYGTTSAESLRRALMDSEPVTIHQRLDELTASLTRAGQATGVLLGGTLGVIAKAVGWACPAFAGAILLIEAAGAHLGDIDGSLTQLIRSGVLDGLRGVAVGQFIDCGQTRRGIFSRTRRIGEMWTVRDVLQDRLAELNVPVLGGLPIGHGPAPVSVPLGTMATIDTTAGTLTVAPCTE